MLKSNEYFYNDEYMYFTFNTTHSSKYNLIIQNDIDDLKIYADRGSKVDFLQPANQTGQYMLGVSHPQRQFPLKLVAQNLSRRDVREVTKWLETGTTGTLSFDYAPDWEYDVVVSALKDPNIYPTDDGTFVMSLEVTFVTMEEAIAHNMNDGILSVHLTGETGLQANGAIQYAPRIQKELLIPPFSVQRIEDDDEGRIQLLLKVYFLGNQKASINVVASIDSDIDQPEEGEPLYSTELKIEVEDILERQNSAAHIVYPINQQPKLYTLEYNNLSNSFLINGKLAETYVLSNQLPGKSSDEDTNYTYFIHNPTSIQVRSDGEPIYINDYNEEELEQLFATYKKYFIYSIQETGVQLSDLLYYIPSTFEEHLYRDEWFIDAPVDELDLAYDNYFGYYQTIKITVKNYTDLTFTVRQYNNTL